MSATYDRYARQAKASVNHHHRTSSRSSYSTSSSMKATSGDIIIHDKVGKRRYRRGHFLGKGGFAKCYELYDCDTGKLYAGKIVAKSTLAKNKAKEKVFIPLVLPRIHVVNFNRYFEDHDNVYILLECCESKSLMELHKRRRAITEHEVRYYMHQIVLATEYMHGRNVIHRDLKLGNLFLDGNMEVKVGDFGLATTITYPGERKKTLCGTPNYIAPEILSSTDGHSFEVDAWSIGCIMYTLLVGKPPFETDNIKTTYRKIKANDYTIPSSARISEEGRSLIRQLLHRNPKSRPKANEMLSHPFFVSGPFPKSLPTSALTMSPSVNVLELRKKGDLAINTDENETNESNKRSTTKSSSRGVLKTINRDTAEIGLKSTIKKSTLIGAPTVAKFSGRQQTTAGSSKSSKFTIRSDESKSKPLPDAFGSSNRRESLETLHNTLDSVLQKFAATKGGYSATSSAPAPEIKRDEINSGLWITKWVDYSNKYGLGYQLSDESVGVLFNDSTKMILGKDGKNVNFISREKDGGKGGGDMVKGSSSTKEAMPYVKKWLRTKHAIVFRLSNNIVQINFFDHTKFIMNGIAQICTYIDKNRVARTYKLSDLCKSTHNSHAVVMERLTYARDVVGFMRGGKAPKVKEEKDN
eukprot:UC4_evm2s1504